MEFATVVTQFNHPGADIYDMDSQPSPAGDSVGANKVRAFVAFVVTTSLFAADVAACISMQHAWSM